MRARFRLQFYLAEVARVWPKLDVVPVEHQDHSTICQLRQPSAQASIRKHLRLAVDQCQREYGFAARREALGQSVQA